MVELSVANPVKLQDRSIVAEGTIASDEELERFSKSQRYYLETSAFNYLFDTLTLQEIELTRAYMRRKGVIFVASPIVLWEIMLVSDLERADKMLLAAQALFDPVLLGTPTELTIRYLRSAYPQNIINYDVVTALSWASSWPAMTRELRRTFEFDVEQLRAKTAPIRQVSRNLKTVLESEGHERDMVGLTAKFVSMIFGAIHEDVELWKLDEVTAKMVILYGFLLLMAGADLDAEPAREFWREKGFHGEDTHAEVTRMFIDYPDIFRQGPLVTMAAMAALQYKSGKTNRGALHDGMHLIYAPHVHAILSNDAAFLDLASTFPWMRAKVRHMSEINLRMVEVPLNDYPDALQTREGLEGHE